MPPDGPSPGLCTVESPLNEQPCGTILAAVEAGLGSVAFTARVERICTGRVVKKAGYLINIIIALSFKLSLFLVEFLLNAVTPRASQSFSSTANCYAASFSPDRESSSWTGWYSLILRDSVSSLCELQVPCQLTREQTWTSALQGAEGTVYSFSRLHIAQRTNRSRSVDTSVDIKMS